MQMRQAHQPEEHIWLKRYGYSRRETEVNRSLFEPRAMIVIGDQCAERCQSTGARLRPAPSALTKTDPPVLTRTDPPRGSGLARAKIGDPVVAPISQGGCFAWRPHHPIPP